MKLLKESYPSSLIKYLKSAEAQEYLRDYRIQDLYDEYGGYAYDLTNALLSIGIEPWKYMQWIPPYFMKEDSPVTSLEISGCSIGTFAFGSCKNLTKVKILNGVTRIGEQAFIGCTGLTSVIIPASVTTIEEYAFNGCSSLTNLEILEGVTTIGRGAFSGCKALTNVVIPKSVHRIAISTFYGCSPSLHIKAPKELQNILKYATNGQEPYLDESQIEYY